MKKIYEIIVPIKEIYPPYLVLLAIFPILTGYAIFFDYSDRFAIIVAFVWLPVFTIPYSLTGKRAIYYLAVLLYFLFGLLEILHWLILKGPLTTTSLLVTSNTNFDEAIEFLNVKANSNLFLLLPYTLITILAFKNRPEKIISKYKLHFVLLTILGMIVFNYRTISKKAFLLKGVPQIVRVGESFLNEIQLHNKAIANNHLKSNDAVSISNHKEEIFLLILGESASRNHMSLYKYKKNTNPRLREREDIIIYNNVVSPYSNTINSVTSMLSDSNLVNDLSLDKSTDLIDVFHAANFKTYWISNQSPVGVWENIISAMAGKSDQTIFVNLSANSSDESFTKRSYDSKLFEPFNLALQEENIARKFIVLHLSGSHMNYRARYPKDFEEFSGDSKKEKIIAEYDNSILYNDFIVDSLLNSIKNLSIKKSIVSSAIYLSDHGENVYDELDLLGHDFVKSLPKSNVEIPFFIWLSPKFKEFDSIKSSTLELDKNLPFVSDDLFHCVIDLNEIQSSLFEKNRSLFNKKYDSKRKRILEDGEDYDKK